MSNIRDLPCSNNISYYSNILNLNKKYNVKKFFNTSLFLLLPWVFYPNLENTNLEYSLLPLYFVSTIFHDHDMVLGPEHPITCEWRCYDGCCIMILCMVILTDNIFFSTLFGLLFMNSVFIKKFITVFANIYVASFTQHFQYKIIFIICFLLYSSLFIYLEIYGLKWTTKTCFIWHLLNGISISIAKLFVSGVI